MKLETREDYELAQQSLRVICQMVRGLPCAEVLQRIAEADALGPILHPTMYREKQADMHLDERLWKAAALFKGAVEQMISEINDPADRTPDPPSPPASGPPGSPGT